MSCKLTSGFVARIQLEVAQHHVKYIRFCHPDLQQKCLDVSLKTCSFIAKDTAVKMSHLTKSIQFSWQNHSWKMSGFYIKYPVLLQQQWLEKNLKSHLKYLVFFTMIRAVNVPISHQNAQFLVALFTEEMPQRFIKDTWFCCHKLGWKMSWRLVVLHPDMLKSSPQQLSMA